MKMKTIMFTMLVFLLVGFTSACDYDDTKDCAIEKTIVKGKVYYSDDEVVGGAEVSVSCLHEGTYYTKTVSTKKHGKNEGTYFVLFPQSKCVSGDEVYVSASKDGLTGFEEGDVDDWKDFKCLDVDLAIIDVPLVPEFGVIVGMLTMIGGVAVFFVVRKE